ncbi:hypothetical protein H8959_007420 [Pygathrix nigripes]
MLGGATHTPEPPSTQGEPCAQGLKRPAGGPSAPFTAPGGGALQPFGGAAFCIHVPRLAQVPGEKLQVTVSAVESSSSRCREKHLLQEQPLQVEQPFQVEQRALRSLNAENTSSERAGAAAARAQLPGLMGGSTLARMNRSCCDPEPLGPVAAARGVSTREELSIVLKGQVPEVQAREPP